MKKYFAVIGFILVFVLPGILNATEGYDYEAITVSSASIGFTASKLDPASSKPTSKVFCTVETDQVRFRYDGGTPTDAIGHLANSGDRFTITGYESIVKFRAIRVTTDASLKCTFER